MTMVQPGATAGYAPPRARGRRIPYAPQAPGLPQVNYGQQAGARARQYQAQQVGSGIQPGQMYTFAGGAQPQARIQAPPQGAPPGTQPQLGGMYGNPNQPGTYLPPGRHQGADPRMRVYAGRNAMNALELQQAGARQQQYLGPLADQLGIPGGRPLTRGDVPLLQAAENYRAQQQAQGDLEAGVEALQRGRADFGQDQASTVARDLAIERALGGGSYTDDFLDFQRGLIKDRAAVGLRDAQRRMEEDLARRGIQGGVSSTALAELQQRYNLGAQGELANFEMESARAREEASANALAQLEQLASRESAGRLGLDRALAEAYLTNERNPLDLSVLLSQPKKKNKLPGGKAPNRQNIGKG